MMNFAVSDGFFRQLLLIYEFIHYRLDRPMLPAKLWPEYHRILKEALRKCLDDDAVPREWIKEIIWGNRENAEFRRTKYELSRSPLSLTAKEEIRSCLNKLIAIEKSAGKISSNTRRNKYLKNELKQICRRAFSKAWETADIIGFGNL